MNKICTSIDQSQKLIELGVDINTADMYWRLTNQNHPPVIGKYCAEYGGMQLPAWSMTALLGMLAEQSFIIKTIENEFNIDIPIRHCKIWFPSLFDAAFEMVVWLKENDKL